MKNDWGPSQAKPSQAKPSQAKLLTGDVDVPCLLATPMFDRISRLSNRHLNSNKEYAYANDFEVRMRALTDHAKN